jgi:hypothetical protein
LGGSQGVDSACGEGFEGADNFWDTVGGFETRPYIQYQDSMDVVGHHHERI